MNKEEILAKSREENRGIDERDRYINDKSDVCSLIVVIVIGVVMLIVKSCFGQNADDIICIFWGVCFGEAIYKGVKNKSKKRIAAAVPCFALMVVFFVRFIINLL